MASGSDKIIDGEVVWTDYPENKFGKKIDWWVSPEGLDLIREWRSSGYTIKDIYTKMGVDPRTFRTWRKKHPEIDDILAVGKEIATSRVINALYRRALGYDYQESIQELIDGVMVTTKIFTKHMPPDTKAILAYLYNRESQEWRAVQPVVDVNLPAIQNAEDILVKIRNTVDEVPAEEPIVVPAEECVSDATEGTSL